MDYTKEDLKVFKHRDIKPEQIDRQLANFEKGFDYVDLSEPATIGNGIIRIEAEDEERLNANLDSKSIIKGVSADPRIGNHYNNPSFGYGGYCLPKDSKQLYSNYDTIPSALFKSIIDSNEVRKDFVSEDILAKNPETIGVYRLVMKKGSDNFRKSAIFDVINNLKEKGANIVIYEPNLDGEDFEGMKLIRNLDDFKKVDLIIANRVEDDLKDVEDKLYTRDLFERD